LYIYDNIHPASIFDEDPRNQPFMPTAIPDFPAVLVWFDPVKSANLDFAAPRALPNLSRLLGLPVEVEPIVVTADGGAYLMIVKNGPDPGPIPISH
jgi:hypothetical protein